MGNFSLAYKGMPVKLSADGEIINVKVAKTLFEGHDQTTFEPTDGKTISGGFFFRKFFS